MKKLKYLLLVSALFTSVCSEVFASADPEGVWQELRTEWHFPGLKMLEAIKSDIDANKSPYDQKVGSVGNVKKWVAEIFGRIDVIKKEAGTSRPAYIEALHAYGKELVNLRKTITEDREGRTFIEEGDATHKMYQRLVSTVSYLLDDFKSVR